MPHPVRTLLPGDWPAPGSGTGPRPRSSASSGRPAGPGRCCAGTWRTLRPSAVGCPPWTGVDLTGWTCAIPSSSERASSGPMSPGRTASTIRCIAGSSVGAPALFRARTAGRAASPRKVFALPAGSCWAAACASCASFTASAIIPGWPSPALSGGPWCAPARSPFGEAWCCGLCKARRRAGVRAQTRATGA